jgi:hypothetical protein
VQRRDFLKSGVALAVAAELGASKAHGLVRAHKWDKYEFGSGLTVTDRLNQGPFPQYAPDAAIPSDEVVMTTTPTDEDVPNYGKGLVTYITADSGTDEIKADDVLREIEELVRFPLGQQLYIRPTWREVQSKPGRIELPDYLKLVFDLAKKYNKRIGLRVQMSAPDYTHSAALPDFVLDKVPKVDLVLNDKENSAAAKRYLNILMGSISRDSTILFFNRRSKIWLPPWRRNSTEARRSSSSIPSCMGFGAKVIRGLSLTILFLIIRPPSGPGRTCSKSSLNTSPRLLC